MKVSKSLSVLFITLLISLSTWAGVKKGQLFPKIQLPQLVGKAPKLKGKVVLVDVWASWCKPCEVAMPEYNRLLKKYRAQGFEIIGINVDENKTEAKKFLKRTPIQFSSFIDAEKKLVQDLGIQAMPTSFLIGHDGRVRLVKRGFRPGDIPKLEKKIQKLLRKAKR